MVMHPFAMLRPAIENVFRLQHNLLLTVALPMNPGRPTGARTTDEKLRPRGSFTVQLSIGPVSKFSFFSSEMAEQGTKVYGTSSINVPFVAYSAYKRILKPVLVLCSSNTDNRANQANRLALLCRVWLSGLPWHFLCCSA